LREMGLGGGCGGGCGSLRPVESVRWRSCAKGVGGSFLESEVDLRRSRSRTSLRLDPPPSDKGLGMRFRFQPGLNWAEFGCAKRGAELGPGLFNLAGDGVLIEGVPRRSGTFDSRDLKVRERLDTKP